MIDRRGMGGLSPAKSSIKLEAAGCAAYRERIGLWMKKCV
jgi:hypothetical protein